jgi:hypothetical protein
MNLQAISNRLIIDNRSNEVKSPFVLNLDLTYIVVG